MPDPTLKHAASALLLIAVVALPCWLGALLTNRLISRRKRK